MSRISFFFLPFLIFPAGKETPKYIQYVGKVLPAAVFGLLAAMAVPAAVFACCFPPWETYDLQRTSFPFWLSACIYNLTYGVLFTVLMALAVRRAATPKLRRQKKTVALLVLPLMWYWLVTIFVFHTLQLQGLLKLWEWNSLLVAGAICFYLYLAFHDGVMGVRLNAEHYRWEAESQTAFRGAQFMAHALKHDLTKLSWCAQNLSRGEDPPPEAAVVSHAVEHLTALQERICMQTGALELRVEACALGELLESWNLEEYGHRGMALVLDLEREEGLLCDRFHTAEVMRNLLDNAWEAAGPDCTVRLALRKRVRLRGHRGRFDRLTVADNGPGILPEELPPREDLWFILRHELTHFRRRDILYKTLLLCANLVHWFNPLTWVLLRSAEGDLERCCDDDVVKGLPDADRARYGQVILDAVRSGR